MQRRSKLDADEFNRIVQQKLNPNMTTNIKTIFEVAEDRGREEGREEGEMIKARIAILNMLKLNLFPLEQIADILDVELDFVLNVKEEWILNPLLSA